MLLFSFFFNTIKLCWVAKDERFIYPSKFWQIVMTVRDGDGGGGDDDDHNDASCNGIGGNL